MRAISIIWIMCTVIAHTAIMTTARYVTDDWWVHAGFTFLMDACIAIVFYSAASRIKMMYSESERSMYLMKTLKSLPKKVNPELPYAELHRAIIKYVRSECRFIEKISCDIMFGNEHRRMITCAWYDGEELKTKIFEWNMEKKKCKEYTGHYEVTTLSPESQIEMEMGKKFEENK